MSDWRQTVTERGYSGNLLFWAVVAELVEIDKPARRFEKMMPPNHCSLLLPAQQLGWPECKGPLQRGHVLNKTLLAGNKAALDLVETKYARYFMRWQCAFHNRERFADTAEARRAQLGMWPRVIIEKALDEINGCFNHPVFRLEELIGGTNG